MPAPPPQSSPPDRSGILTEQINPRTTDLHTLSVADCVARIQAEDRAIPEALAAAAPALTRFITLAEPGFLAGGRLVYVGAGTSGRLGVLDASEAPPTFQVEPGRVVGLIAGGDAALRRSSEGCEDDPAGARADLEALGLTRDDSLLGIAAGGTTAYVLGALRIARELGVGVTGLLTCSPTPHPESCDVLIVIPTGPEVLAGSTRMKAGTATKQALNTISTTLMVRAGRVYGNLMVDLRATNDKLRDRGARIVSTLTGLPRGEALGLLERAGWSVKVAVLMHRLALDHAAATRTLDAARGRLDVALGENRGAR
jgi:N-acetylmuramic acid 6-phosphate etherase